MRPSWPLLVMYIRVVAQGYGYKCEHKRVWRRDISGCCEWWVPCECSHCCVASASLAMCFKDEDDACLGYRRCRRCLWSLIPSLPPITDRCHRPAMMPLDRLLAPTHHRCCRGRCCRGLSVAAAAASTASTHRAVAA